MTQQLPAAATPSPVPDVYERLMSVTVRHDFYANGLRGDAPPCPDFVIEPTHPSSDLLRYLGLLARPRQAGIDILYRRSHSGGMLQYLWQARHRRQTARRSHLDLPRAKDGSWSRIGLTFTLRHELFANFTDLPHSALPGREALYLTNRNCEDAGGNALRLPSQWSEHAVMVPPVGVTPGNFEFKTRTDTKNVRIYDTSGRTVFYAAPNVRDEFSGEHSSETRPPHAELAPGKAVHPRLGGTASGLYSYVTHDGGRTIEQDFFCFTQRDPPLLYADLHFASPEHPVRRNDHYPVELPDERPDQLSAAEAASRVTPRHYEIVFTARQTYWIYYVVLPANTGIGDGLAIEPITTNAPQFSGPEPVTLATGVTAARFTASKAWPLRHRSDTQLRLRGAAAVGNGARKTLLERLPTPSAERIGFAGMPSGIAPDAAPPRSLPPNAITSEVLVFV